MKTWLQLKADAGIATDTEVAKRARINRLSLWNWQRGANSPVYNKLQQVATALRNPFYAVTPEMIMAAWQHDRKAKGANHDGEASD